MLTQPFKLTNKILLTSIAILVQMTFSLNLFAQDDPVHCTTTTSEVSVYAGFASCHASTRNGVIVLSEYIGSRYSRTVRLSELQWDDGVSYTVGCTATLGFSHTDYVSSETCEYTPKALFSVAEYSPGYVTINDFSTDRDGSIVKWEFWLNGVKRATSNSSANIGGNWPIAIGSQITMKMVVTDNDGHTDSQTKTRLTQGLPPCNLDPMADHCR